MKTKPMQRILALALAAVMVLAMIPAGSLPVTAEAVANKIDVWDFGAEQLDTSIYNNNLSVDEINSWYPGVAPGTSGQNLASFTTRDGQVSFNDGGYSMTHRLRTDNTALTRYDGKTMTVDGVVHHGYIYSNKGSNKNVYVSVEATAGDIISMVIGGNKADSTVAFEGPDGVEKEAVAAKAGQLLTFYPKKTGTYKVYSVNEKLLVARIYREHTNEVAVSGTVTAPAELTGYSLVFTNTVNGAETVAAVENGKYTAKLNASYTYNVSLKDANGYIIVSEKALTLDKTATEATFDVSVAQVSLVTVTGNITGLDTEALSKLHLTFETTATYKPEVVISGSTYSVEVEVGTEYTVKAEGINDYALTSSATVSYTEAGTADITFAAKPTYAVTIVPEGMTTAELANATFTFTNLNEEGYVYTFTGTEGIALRDGVYSVKVTNIGDYVQKLTSNLTVNGAAVSKTIAFEMRTTPVEVPYKATVTVGASGCDYTTINAALDAVRAMNRPNNERVTIAIQPGNYEEMLVIDVPNVTLKNASSTPSIELTNKGVDIDANAVRITHYYGHGYTYYSMGSDCKYDPEILKVNKENGYPSFVNPGSGTTAGSYWNATVVITTSGFEAEGIIFENSFNQYVSAKAADDVIVAQANNAKEPAGAPRADLPAGSTAVQDKSYVERAAALAIANNCTEISFDNCKFIGRQDTLYGGTGVTAAFYDCAIYGGTDYIFGGMTAVFAKCDLVFNTSEDGNDVGYITAAQQKSGRGYLMYNCTVTSTTPGVDTASEFTSKPGYLGRPWQANTSEVVFYNTVIGASDPNWYSISPSLIRPEGWLSTLGGESNITGEYGSYEMAKDVDNTDKRVAWANKFVDEKLADGTPITVEAFLGSWDAFAGKDMTIVIPTDKIDNKPAEEPTEGDPTYVLDATADLTAFDRGVKADGDSEVAGTSDYFKIYYSAKSKVDGSNKTFDDGYTGSQRINFGGKMDLTVPMNAVEITTKNPATVKVWWVEGGDTGDKRQVVIANASGETVATTNVDIAKNATCVSTLELTEAGKYYIGNLPNNNYFFKIEVTEHLPKEYILDTTADLTAFVQGTKADGDSETAGTEDFFTVYYGAKTKVDGSAKTFEDGYVGEQRLNFGGKSDLTVPKNLVMFKTTGAATVKIWWVQGGEDNRPIAIWNANGDTVAISDVQVAKNATCITTFEVPEAGTYYLANPVNNNNFYKISVTVGGSSAPAERADWATVAAPVITAAEQVEGEITVTVSAVVGNDGADEVVVTMMDKDGKELASKRSIKEAGEHVLTFAPSASGEYTFKAVMNREGETAKESAEAKTVSYKLPLGVPAISSATSKGNGAIELKWSAVDEATGYAVYCNGQQVGTTAETSYVVTGLTVGEKYTFTVAAVRGDEVGTVSAEVTATATAEAQTTWSFVRYGPSTDDNNNGYTGNLNEDGKVTVYSTGGKGKIQPTGADGLAFYYTAVPNNYNFTLRANIHVDSWKYSNGQEGFGLLALDSEPTHGASSFWTNQYMAMASKVEYFWDSEKGEVSTSEGTKYSMRLGIGANAKLGITPEVLAQIEANDRNAINKVANGITYPLETTAAQQGLPKDNYNVIGNYDPSIKGMPTSIAEITDFVLEIQRNNTGYFISCYDMDGNLMGQQKNYDPNALSVLDSENVYVGLFASRNATATFSNVTLTTVLPENDAPAEEKPVTKVEPKITITSGAVANSENYKLAMTANVAGTAKVTVNGEVVAENVPLTANVRANVDVLLTKNNNKIVVTFTPDPNQDLGEDTVLANTDPVETSINVSYETKFANQNNLYIAPNGKPTGNGGPEYPLDVYTAVSVVRPGQTIVVMEGTYYLERTVRIERGMDGTAEKPILMVVDPNAKTRPVFDFQGKSAGFVHGGNYWYFQGFDVTHSADGQKGFQLSGNSNILDKIDAYHNGNTGIQISRLYAADEFPDWPANNLVLNCTSYGNADAGYEDADGFAAKLTVGEGNVFDGCVAHHNADDGWDLYAKVATGPIGAVTIKNCVAYANGYLEDGTDAGNGNGFKMGGDGLSGHHKLINSIAFWNKAKGFDSNSCPDISVENSTAYNNESYNVAFYTKNNSNTDFAATGIVSFKDATIKSGLDVYENLKPEGNQDVSKYLNDTNYYWNGSSKNTSGDEITADMFVSLEFKGILRNSDGTINMQGFLELNEKAPKNVGAKMSGTASGTVVITPDKDLPIPATGDEASLLLWAVLLVVSAAALSCGYSVRKRF